MATYFVTTANWNSPAFWSGINEGTSGHTLDFSGLGSGFSITLDAATGELIISDGVTTFTVGDSTYGGAPDATMGGATVWSFFTTFNGTQGADSVDFSSSTNAHDIDGGAGDDTLYGGSNNDTISGGDGADTINGGSGNDVIDGGADADQIWMSDGHGNDTVTGGEGVTTGSDLDRLNFSQLTTSGVTVTYTGNEAGTVTSGAGTVTFSQIEEFATTNFADVIDGSASTVGITVWTNDGNDTVTGTSANDFISTLNDDDSVDGGAGNDTIYAGAGNDSVRGGDGNDLINSGTGADTLYGDAGTDQFFMGSGDVAFGGDGRDIFWYNFSSGTGGTMTVDGGNTGETSVGDQLTLWWDGTGFVTDNQTVTFTSNGAGTVTGTSIDVNFTGIEAVSAGHGNDTIDASVNTTSLYLEGDEGDDSVVGGSGDDTLRGDEGSDTLVSGAGNDFMVGWTGDDRFEGGTGDDTILGQDGDDTFVLTDNFGNDSITGGEVAETSGDTLDLSGVTQDLTIDLTAANPETGTVSNGTDTASFTEIENITLGGGRDTIALADGSGTDLVYAFDMADSGDGSTNDQLDVTALTDAAGSPVNVNDVTVTDDGSGNAVLTFPNGEAITLVGVAPAQLSTSAQLASIGIPEPDFIVEGTAGADVIDTAYVGDPDGDMVDNNDHSDGSHDDVIYGYDGNDTIRSSLGSDTIYAGDGDDSVHAGSVIPDGDNYVDGGAGNDFLHGGLYSAGNLGDTVLGGDGNDTIIGSAGGTANVILDGGTGNDSITLYTDSSATGGTATIDGGSDLSGADVDTLSVNHSTFDLSRISSVDVTLTGEESGTMDYTSGVSGEQGTASFTEIEAFSLSYGNDTFDGSLTTDGVTVFGNDGDDSITAGAGDDSISGGGGDDSLTGGAGDDLFTYNSGADTIADFNTGNTGTLNDGDTTNNDSIDLSGHYDHISELYADQADDGILNQSNITDTRGQTVDYSDNTQFGAGDSLTFQGASADSSSFTAENTGVVCFTSGTAIRTPRGDVLIEELKLGDLVCTQDNGPQPIRWIGTRRVSSRELAIHRNLRPVLIRRGVLGAERDLLVSAQHGMLMPDQTLIRAKHLAEAGGIPVRIAHGRRTVTYIHLMFDAHQIIFAENTRSESFFPGPMALAALEPETLAEFAALFPEPILATSAPAKAWYGAPARSYARRNDAIETIFEQRALVM